MRKLASLVGGAVEGMVRETGCRIMTNSTIAAGVRQKGEWLVLLEPGTRRYDGWIEAIVHHIAASTSAARFRKVANGRERLFRGTLFPRRADRAAPVQ